MSNSRRKTQRDHMRGLRDRWLVRNGYVPGKVPREKQKEIISAMKERGLVSTKTYCWDVKL